MSHRDSAMPQRKISFLSEKYYKPVAVATDQEAFKAFSRPPFSPPLALLSPFSPLQRLRARRACPIGVYRLKTRAALSTTIGTLRQSSQSILLTNEEPEREERKPRTSLIYCSLTAKARGDGPVFCVYPQHHTTLHRPTARL